jgi:hypothetical protein
VQLLTYCLSCSLQRRKIKEPNEEALTKSDDVNAEAETVEQYAMSFPFQLKITVGRTFKAFWRLPDCGYARLFSQ